MSNINTVAVSGRVTRDLELRSLPSGSSVTEIGLAVNRNRKDGDDWVEEVSFFDISVFGKYAENCAKKLRKGDTISVAGRLEQQRWESDAGNRSKVVIIADKIDGEGFYRSADENNDVQATPATAASESAAPAATAADDDIPF